MLHSSYTMLILFMWLCTCSLRSDVVSNGKHMFHTAQNSNVTMYIAYTYVRNVNGMWKFPMASNLQCSIFVNLHRNSSFSKRYFIFLYFLENQHFTNNCIIKLFIYYLEYGVHKVQFIYPWILWYMYIILNNFQFVLFWLLERYMALLKSICHITAFCRKFVWNMKNCLLITRTKIFKYAIDGLGRSVFNCDQE